MNIDTGGYTTQFSYWTPEHSTHQFGVCLRSIIPKMNAKYLFKFALVYLQAGFPPCNPHTLRAAKLEHLSELGEESQTSSGVVVFVAVCFSERVFV